MFISPKSWLIAKQLHRGVPDKRHYRSQGVNSLLLTNWSCFWRQVIRIRLVYTCKRRIRDLTDSTMGDYWRNIMSIFAWIILGLVAGFIGSKIVNKRGEGLVLDLVDRK